MPDPSLVPLLGPLLGTLAALVLVAGGWRQALARSELLGLAAGGLAGWVLAGLFTAGGAAPAALTCLLGAVVGGGLVHALPIFGLASASALAWALLVAQLAAAAGLQGEPVSAALGLGALLGLVLVFVLGDLGVALGLAAWFPTALAVHGGGEGVPGFTLLEVLQEPDAYLRWRYQHPTPTQRWLGAASALLFVGLCGGFARLGARDHRWRGADRSLQRLGIGLLLLGALPLLAPAAPEAARPWLLAPRSALGLTEWSWPAVALLWWSIAGPAFGGNGWLRLGTGLAATAAVAAVAAVLPTLLAGGDVHAALTDSLPPAPLHPHAAAILALAVLGLGSTERR